MRPIDKGRYFLGSEAILRKGRGHSSPPFIFKNIASTIIQFSILYYPTPIPRPPHYPYPMRLSPNYDTILIFFANIPNFLQHTSRSFPHTWVFHFLPWSNSGFNGRSINTHRAFSTKAHFLQRRPKKNLSTIVLKILDRSFSLMYSAFIMQRGRDKITSQSPTTVQRYSVKVNGRVSSITIKSYLIGLYLVLNGYKGNSHNFILQEVQEIITEWDYHHNRGISDYVSQKMIERLLEKRDLRDYRAEILKMQEKA